MNIRKLVKAHVASLTAYSARDIPCRIKLDANESPYGFQGAVKAAADIETNRYPDPEATALRKLLAREWKVTPGEILQGNGSDELIFSLITTFGGPVLFPVPTFSMYGIIAQALGEVRVPVPLDRDFDLESRGMRAAIKKMKPQVVFLSSPNNPTGNSFSYERILEVIKASKGIVVVDEAYQPFSAKKSFLPLVKENPNLVVMRTLSKIGLAALRTGFIVGSEGIVHEVNKVRLPYNVNSFSQAIAVEALRNKKEITSAVRTIVTERSRVFSELRHIPGVKAQPSDANFILFRVAQPEDLYNKLLKKGILVKNLNGSIKGCIRVTIGRPEENSEFIAAMKEISRKIS